MSWGKGLIIFLGLMQLSYVAHARDIQSFTDSQGTLHITNNGPKQQGSPANPPSPAAPLRPSSFSGKAPIALPAREPIPQAQAPVPHPEAQVPVPNSEAQAPAPKPEAAPSGPVPVDPQPGSRVTHPEGSGGVMPLAVRTGEKEGPGAVAETSAAPLQLVSWSPPQPGMSSSEGKIVLRRDRQGVIHITNAELDEVPLMAPAAPTPEVQQQARSPAVIPAVHEVSCPELGPEVAAYLAAKLQSHSPVWAGQTIRRHQDGQGTWHIVNEPAPDLQLPLASFTASGGKIDDLSTATPLKPPVMIQSGIRLMPISSGPSAPRPGS